MFMCVLQLSVASTVLVLNSFVNFMAGADRVRHRGVMIVINGGVETRSTPKVAWPLMAEFGGRVLDS